MTKWEYVASGMNHTLRDQASFKHEVAIAETRRMVNILNSSIPNSSFAVLFNAFTEANLGDKLKSLYANTVKYYCDSGGLQMITLGKSVTDNLKNEIYMIQSKYSDFAMSFDEIPQILLAEKSSIQDRKTRAYSREIHKECALKSAVNLKRQIETLKNQETSSKPFLIVHGSTLEEYQNWIDINLEYIGSDNWRYVGGIAAGGAGLGPGMREDFLKAYFASKVQAPEEIKRHIHILGVGAIKRLSPFIALTHSGHFSNSLISYDSTSHTCSSTMGNYYPSFKCSPLSVSRAQRAKWPMIFNDLSSTTKSIFDINLDPVLMESFYFDPRPSYSEKMSSECDSQRQIMSSCWLLSQVYHFSNHLNKACLDFDFMAEFLDDREFMAAKTFKDIRDHKDFADWYNNIGNKLASKQIQIVSSNLEGLFE